MNVEHLWNDTDGEKNRSTGRESGPIATPSTINPSWTDMGSESCRLVLPADDISPESWHLVRVC